MRHILCILSLFICLQSSLFAEENASHLRGINFLYMNIDSSFASEVTAMERLDLSDIMELQLRRGNIELRSFIANKPELNVPLIELSIDTSNRVSTGQFDLVLRVRDHVTYLRAARFEPLVLRVPIGMWFGRQPPSRRVSATKPPANGLSGERCGSTWS